MKLPSPSGRLVPVVPAEPRAVANEDAPRRRAPERVVRKPELPLDADVESPFLRPDRRTRHRRLRRGPVWGSVRMAQVGALAVLAFVALWIGYVRVMSSERLKVARIEVRGSHYLSEGEVRELLGAAMGENILSLDIEELKARLRASPWVAEATVVRSLPDVLRVQIRERHPVALAELDRLYLMDASGDLVALHGPRTSAFDLPIVRGLQELAPDERRRRTNAAGAVLDDLGELGAAVSEVLPQADGDVRLVLRPTGDVVVLAGPPARDRVAAFLGMREQLVARVGHAEYWDLRFRDRVFAKPAPPPPTPPPAVVLPAAPPVAAPVAPATPLSPDDSTRVLPAEPSSVPPAVAIPVAATAPSGR